MQQNLTPIIAALANSDCQRMYAQIVLGQAPESPNRRERKLIDRLKTVGLVTEDPAGSLILTDVFTEYLLAGKYERGQETVGVQRFLVKGRVQRWPSRAEDKDALLRWIITESIAESERLAESELNDRIRRYTEDPALVRRYGVDFGMLRRDPATQIYYLSQ